MRIRKTLVPATAVLVVLGSAFGCTTILGDFEVSAVTTPGPEAGTPDTSVSDAPTVETGGDSSTSRLTGAKAVTSGARHSCVLTNDNEVYCWGDNADGQLGLPATTLRSERPVKISLPSDVKTLVAGAFHTCAVTTTFAAYCWGRNACGQVGAGDDQNPSREPRKVVGPTSSIDLQWTAISPGLDHTCGIESGGATYCWGCNTSLQAGAIGQNPSNRPVNAGVEKQNATAVSAGATYTCILGSASTRTRCWGTAERGALGNGPPLSDATETAVEADVGGNVTAIGTGDRHTCAIDANKNGLCWGDNNFGQLGNPDIAGPLDAPGNRIAGGQALAVGAGGNFTCIIAAADSTVRCFGGNQNGELGRAGAPDTATHPTPEPVVQPGAPSAHIQASSIGVGREHACAVLTGSGEVVCWGKGSDGQLGDGTAGGDPRTMPVFVLPPR
jgi:alpha-tubulin suppressor-like RCC1 family protein